jgi:hypothetical protein
MKSIFRRALALVCLALSFGVQSPARAENEVWRLTAEQGIVKVDEPGLQPKDAQQDPPIGIGGDSSAGVGAGSGSSGVDAKSKAGDVNPGVGGRGGGIGLGLGNGNRTGSSR